MRFALVDIETTGSHAKGHGITEIAIIISDGNKELERWESLVDPGAPIPLHITRLTGIDDDMVAKAPPLSSNRRRAARMVGRCCFCSAQRWV
ncbi:exonuclease domain-containing protein [bacterium]|nr:exonuclease domain-containing protein [bacterium]